MQNWIKGKRGIKNIWSLVTIITTCNSCWHYYFHIVLPQDMVAVEAAARTSLWSMCRLINNSLHQCLDSGDSVLGKASANVSSVWPQYMGVRLGTVGRIHHEQWLYEAGQDSLSATEKQMQFIWEQKLNYLRAALGEPEVVLVHLPSSLSQPNTNSWDSLRPLVIFFSLVNTHNNSSV